MPARGRYDRETVAAILDEGLVAHVGFVDPAGGYPVVLPMAYARVDDTLYLHGSSGSRQLRTLSAGAEICVTVTLVDGLVLARSGFHHSMNYRCAVVLGRTRPVHDDDESVRALDAIVDHVSPGRSAGLRPPTERERAATFVVAVGLAEASAKVRTGPPVDEPDDLDWPVWAGVVPVAQVAGEPEPDAHLWEGLAPPSVR